MGPIYIHLKESDGEKLKVGASHWFGYPDLPENIEIPTVEEDGEEFGLTLICQVNLEDIPQDCKALPHNGLLLFFADIAYYCGDCDEPAISMSPSNNKVCRVLYIPKDKMDTLVNRSEQYADTDEIPAIPITLDHTPANLDEPELQLLGESWHLEWETWPEPCEGWQLLLQMDSMEGAEYLYNFMDWGVLCFLIDKEKLKELDFSDVRTIILSTLIR